MRSCTTTIRHMHNTPHVKCDTTIRIKRTINIPAESSWIIYERIKLLHTIQYTVSKLNVLSKYAVSSDLLVALQNRAELLNQLHQTSVTCVFAQNNLNRASPHYEIMAFDVKVNKLTRSHTITEYLYIKWKIKLIVFSEGWKKTTQQWAINNAKISQKTRIKHGEKTEKKNARQIFVWI